MSVKTATLLPAIQHLMLLPRDKRVLDFVLNKLVANSSPERFDFIQQLFEMHRTSVGFDPVVLSKTRFKRFKSAEVKTALRELDTELALITATGEYRHLVSGASNYKQLFEEYQQMLDLLSAPPSRELSEQVDKFTQQLYKEGAYELLLLFYRNALAHYEKQNKNCSSVLAAFDELSQKVKFYSDYILSNLKTLQILLEAEEGNYSQEKLLLHLNTLKTLIDKSPDLTSKYELIHRVVQCGQLLERRISYLSPYYNLVFRHEIEMELLHSAVKDKLMLNGIIYADFEENALKISRLTALEKQAVAKEDHFQQLYIKHALTLLKAESESDTDAIKAMHETEHLFYRNGFKSGNVKKIWVEHLLLKYFSLLYNEEVKEIITPEEEYQQVIRSLNDLCLEMPAYADAPLLLNSIRYLAKGLNQNATVILNGIDHKRIRIQLYCLRLLVVIVKHILDKNNLSKKAIEELRELREPFYSSKVAELFSLLDAKANH